MPISQANAEEAAPVTTTATSVAVADPAVPAADATQTLMFNIGFILLLFVFFYILMIRPQQKRMKEQQTMLDDLKAGDRVITNGGIIGTIIKNEGNGEVELEIAPNAKVTVLRYSIYKKYDPAEFAPKKDAK